MIIYKKLSDITSELTTHNVGLKSVLLTQKDTITSITQFAFGVMNINEEIDQHIHETMEEIYYFIKGAGVFYINEKEYSCTENTFIKIPAGYKHQLKSIGLKPLEFIYLGIAINKI